jgi:hypothetical protein
MSHTPGPWKIERHFDPGYKNISAQKHTSLAQVVWCMEDEDRSPSCEANAHLIAAAPMMYSLLANRAESGDYEARKLIEAIGNEKV